MIVAIQNVSEDCIKNDHDDALCLKNFIKNNHNNTECLRIKD